MVWTITGKGGVVKFNPYNPIIHSIHVGHVDLQLHHTIHGSYAGKYLDEQISQDVGPSTATYQGTLGWKSSTGIDW